jgi:hypothetical protein
VTNRQGDVVQVVLLDDHFGFGGATGSTTTADSTTTAAT